MRAERIGILILLSMIFIVIVIILMHLINGQRQNKNQQLEIFQYYPIKPASGVNNYQTEFFKKSIEHAKNVLRGIVKPMEYGSTEENKKLIDLVSMLNDKAKKSVEATIDYYTIDPIIFSNAERELRQKSVEENSSLWFVILRETVKKVVPSLSENMTKEIGGGKIIRMA